MERAFEAFIPVPEGAGLIMVIEKEFGPAGAADWAKAARRIAGIVKCAFGTGALYDRDVLEEKIKAYKSCGISTMIGGSLTESAIVNAGGYEKSHLGSYLAYARSLGFTHIEFSDGSIYVPEDKRRDIIRMCIDAGFNVISEVGKKDPDKDAKLTIEKRIELMEKDLQSGSAMVIIEARESGKGIGVMTADGKVMFPELDRIIKSVGLKNVMIEAPNKGQQQDIYVRYGPGANVGNVQPHDIFSAGALRAGLRGDTMKALMKDAWRAYHRSQNAPEDCM